MLVIKVHKDIFPENDGWYGIYGDESFVFSLEEVQRIFAEHPDEQDVRIDIHSNGGSPTEAFAIYDFLRTSGRNIHTNIEGSCHSAATILLLAAPFENRTANAHATAIIHKVSGEVGGTVDVVEAYAEDMRMIQNQLLDIYADRTKLDRERLAEIVDEQKERTTAELLEWGFIARVNPYITNYAKPTTNKNMINIKNALYEIANKIGGLVGLAPVTVVNYDFVDGEDNVVFTTEGDTAELDINTEVQGEDGVYTLKDGRTVTIEDGKVAKIEEAEDKTESEAEPTNEAQPETEPVAEATPSIEEIVANMRSEIADLKATIENKDAENATYKEQLAEAHSALIEAAKGIKSNKVIGTRINVAESPKEDNKAATDKEALKEALSARMQSKNNRK
jgi:ATP-dependent Clp protease protease subunit